MLHELKHVVMIKGEDLILEGNGPPVDVVGGDPVVPEHQADRFAGGCFQGIAEDGIGHFALQNRAALQLWEVAVFDQLSNGTSLVHGCSMSCHQFANFLFVEHV